MARNVTLLADDLNANTIVLNVDTITNLKVEYEHFPDEFNQRYILRINMTDGTHICHIFETEEELNDFLLTLNDTMNYCCPVGGAVELMRGETYYDIPNDYMYITFGADGNWYAIRYRTVDETTGPQVGAIPTDLVTLQGLSYT